VVAFPLKPNANESQQAHRNQNIPQDGKISFLEWAPTEIWRVLNGKATEPAGISGATTTLLVAQQSRSVRARRLHGLSTDFALWRTPWVIGAQ
jgi:hypothetical protein